MFRRFFLGGRFLRKLFTRKKCKSLNETIKVRYERGKTQMNIYGVSFILGILAFLGIVATTMSIIIITKMKKRIDSFEQLGVDVGISLSKLYKANTFDATREVIGELMDTWLGH